MTENKQQQINNRMSKTLYDDQFVRLTNERVVIKWYYFPTATNKNVKFNEITAVYYTNQLNLFQFKSWGMALTPIWWVIRCVEDVSGNYGV